MIYILEFSQPLHHARYYIGWTKDESTLGSRLKHHEAGRGACITRAAVEHGISWRLVWTMEGDKSVERWLKRQKNTPRLVKQFLAKGA